MFVFGYLEDTEDYDNMNKIYIISFSIQGNRVNKFCTIIEIQTGSDYTEGNKTNSSKIKVI